MRWRKKRPPGISSADSSQESPKNNKIQSAYNAILRRLVRKDYSKNELIKKLTPYYTDEAIQQAIVKACDYNLIRTDWELSTLYKKQWDRRGLGIRAIRQKLRHKGLPSPSQETERANELNKALKALERKIKQAPLQDELNRADQLRQKQKWMRFLAQRGFESDIIFEAIKRLKG